MIRPGIIVRDVDFTDVDSSDLGRFLRELAPLIKAIDDLTEYAPFVRASKSFPGTTELTPMGETFTELREWLQYQRHEAFQALLQTKPEKGEGEYRALDLIEYMSRCTGDLKEIGKIAATLDVQPETVLPKHTGSSWVARYLKERKTYV